MYRKQKQIKEKLDYIKLKTSSLAKATKKMKMKSMKWEKKLQILSGEANISKYIKNSYKSTAKKKKEKKFFLKKDK